MEVDSGQTVIKTVLIEVTSESTSEDEVIFIEVFPEILDGVGDTSVNEEFGNAAADVLLTCALDEVVDAEMNGVVCSPVFGLIGAGLVVVVDIIMLVVVTLIGNVVVVAAAVVTGSVVVVSSDIGSVVVALLEQFTSSIVGETHDSTSPQALEENIKYRPFVSDS